MTTETPVRSRIETVIEFEAAIARFSRVVLAGGVDEIAYMTGTIESMSDTAERNVSEIALAVAEYRAAQS